MTTTDTIAKPRRWGRSSHLGPMWYPIALVLTALPCAWVGGALYRR